MATTTNYGWTTPDDTALVKDGASAIRSLGTAVDTTTKNLNPSTTLGDIEYRSSTANTNTRLAIGSSGQGLQVVAGVPSWAASSTSTLTTTGDLLYASAANTLARRAIGTTGQVLTVSGGLPTWATPTGGGKVLQVVNATYSTATTSASSSFADTGLTASITPSATTSKILVIVDQAGVYKTDQTAGSGVYINLMRGATQIVADFAGAAGFTNTLAFNYVGSSGTSYLDSPATTSSTTYKTQFRSNASGNLIGVQVLSSVSTITLLEIGA
jgi:hypothetical protein